MSRMRIQLQSEVAECGLACVAMIASHHGFDIGLLELRRRFPLSLKGARLAQLIQIASELGFQSRAVRLDMEGLSQLSLPCVLHWDLNHFVVLRKIGSDRATVIDPAIGERELSFAEVSKHFTGVALEVSPSAGFAPRKSKSAVSLRQLAGNISGLQSALGQLLLLSITLQALLLLGPFFMQWVIDQVLVAADRGLLLVLAGGFGLLLLMQVAVAQARGWAVIYLSARMNQQWTSNVFTHLLRLPLDYFEKRNIGDVTSRLSSVQAIQRTLSTSFVEAIIDGMMALTTLCVMLFYSTSLALVTMIAVAVYLGLRALLYRRLRDTTERHLISAARQQTHLLESIRGIQSIKLAVIAPLRRSVYENLTVDAVNQEFGISRITLNFAGINQLIFGIERILVICIGASLAMESVFSVGMLIAYLAYKDQFVLRTAALIDKWVDLRMLKLHAERLADVVLTAPEEVESRTDDVPTGMLGIEVEGLSFRYADGEPWILRDCSFTVEPGSTVAVVGPSGCGKTTLIKLMLGLLTPTEGRILVNGQDIRRLGLERYRRMVAAVMQEDQLFAGSVADNIAFFDPDLDQSRIESAARMAAVHDDIVAMPMSYHSLVGDMGSSLSGGQRQRLILARALYRQPQLIFLDEATSHLDVQRERLVNDAIRELQITKIVVAHRPETIATADRVLSLTAGRVAEAATERHGTQPA